jgi:uncharacterized protein (DUF305 family)
VRIDVARGVLIALLMGIVAASAKDERPFLQKNKSAMDRMMRDMMVAPSGDADRDFAAMMIPHHQGAVDMAMAELRYGHNEQLRRIAQEIIVEQQQEITAMRLAVSRQAVSANGVSHAR